MEARGPYRERREARAGRDQDPSNIGALMAEKQPPWGHDGDVRGDVGGYAGGTHTADGSSGTSDDSPRSTQASPSPPRRSAGDRDDGNGNGNGDGECLPDVQPDAPSPGQPKSYEEASPASLEADDAEDSPGSRSSPRPLSFLPSKSPRPPLHQQHEHYQAGDEVSVSPPQGGMHGKARGRGVLPRLDSNDSFFGRLPRAFSSDGSLEITGRPRLGTDEVPHLPPVHNFFGSYRDISPTTGEFRPGFFPAPTASGEGEGGTPTSSQVAQHGSSTSAGGTPGSASEGISPRVGGGGGAGIPRAGSFDDQSQGSGSVVYVQQTHQQHHPYQYPSPYPRLQLYRQWSGGRDNAAQIQSQSQSQQYHPYPRPLQYGGGGGHDREPSWGNDSRPSSPRMPYPDPYQYNFPHRRTGSHGRQSPHAAAPALTPMLPYHQRRKILQKRREEEAKMAASSLPQPLPLPLPLQRCHHAQNPPQKTSQPGVGGKSPTEPQNIPPRDLPFGRSRTMSNTSFSDAEFDSSPDNSAAKAPGLRGSGGGRRGPPRVPRGRQSKQRQQQAAGSSRRAPHPGPADGLDGSNVGSDRPYHIRTESTGSISSLDSNGPGSHHAHPFRSLTDRLSKDISGFIQVQHQEQGRSFFGMFGTTPPDDSRYTVQDYHKKNQAFLQRTESERALIARRLREPSPKRTTIRSRSPGPPNSRGAHRASLGSIDDDNWEEEHDKKETPKTVSRRRQTDDKSQKSTLAGRGGGKDGHLRSTILNGNKPSDRQLTAFPSRMPKSFQMTSGRDRIHRGLSRYVESMPFSLSKRRASNDKDSYLSSDVFRNCENDDSSAGSSDSFTDPDAINEQTSLLPRRGNNGREIKDYDKGHGRARQSRIDPERIRRKNERSGRRRVDNEYERDPDNSSLRGERSRRTRKSRPRNESFEEWHEDDDSVSECELSASSTSSSQNRRWEKRKARILKRERSRLIAKWKAEALAEAEALRGKEEAKKWHKRFRRLVARHHKRAVAKITSFLALSSAIISNMPLTINAISLAIVTLGVVWFKFAEENLDSCMPVHFHSEQCSFPEFPGCFYCDTSVLMYKVAVYFHYACSTFAGVLAMLFFAKVLLARRVAIDELSSPTTATPAGLICMTMVCVFAGRGMVGQVLVTLAAAMHLCLAIWFIYMALAYRILPDPSWYPNTVGIGLSAVKVWLYYPVYGHFLMAISLTLNCFIFPISLIRVALNHKISAPVGWIQMSAPAIALYALTIMAQPSFEEEQPDVTNFQRVHRMVYLPCMHGLFFLSILGALSSFQSLWIRWGKIHTTRFSPAHAAFCFPSLAHANSIQAYRGAIDAFADYPPDSFVNVAIYAYWVFVLIASTITTLIITIKFLLKLPEWTQIDVSDEIEPPAPKETMMSEIVLAGETLRQRYVNPAVLQAQEAGALVRLPDQYGRARYVRTRKVTALGFEPIMDLLELDEERETLLDWVAKHPPKRRRNTLSVPGIDFSYGYGDFGTNNLGVYDAEAGQGARAVGRGRSRTLDTGRGDGRRSHTLLY